MTANGFNFLALALCIPAGFAAWFLAVTMEKAIVRHREGRPITWTNQCGEKIEALPTKYSWVYIAVACLLLIPVIGFTQSATAAVYVTLELALFLALSLTDIKYRLIPNVLVLGLMLVHVLWMITQLVFGETLNLWPILLQGLIGMAFCFAAFFGGALLTGGKVGMGDVKLSMAIGFILGFRLVLIAIALSGICVMPFLFYQPGVMLKERFKQLVPFGPPFSFAAMIVLAASFTPLADYMVLF